jgi:hypothetical protein
MQSLSFHFIPCLSLSLSTSKSIHVSVLKTLPSASSSFWHADVGGGLFEEGEGALGVVALSRGRGHDLGLWGGLLWHGLLLLRGVLWRRPGPSRASQQRLPLLQMLVVALQELVFALELHLQLRDLLLQNLLGPVDGQQEAALQEEGLEVAGHVEEALDALLAASPSLTSVRDVVVLLIGHDADAVLECCLQIVHQMPSTQSHCAVAAAAAAANTQHACTTTQVTTHQLHSHTSKHYSSTLKV